MLKVGFKTLQTEVSWDQLLRFWEAGDQMEEFDSAWLNDHFVAWRDDGGYLEAMVLATALAARTRRLLIGHTVLSVTHRHPALLAKMTSTLDQIAPGRFIVGLGAGWNEDEHAMYGWTLPPLKDRITMLGDTVQILKGMWANPGGFSYSSDAYHLKDARCEPPPASGGLPVWLGTRGKQRGLRILAQWGDGWAATSDGWTPTEEGSLPEFKELLAVLYDHCDDVGRDRSAIEISIRINVLDKPADWLIRESQAFVEAGAQHVVFSTRATEGAAALEALARDVVRPLREQFGAVTARA
jgi:alkanesulfonate monooxygenase SsuD/methylene tetrahydromethanopterin reductase-like flavin-dependent oxidoreductase (luciferase family)